MTSQSGAVDYSTELCSGNGERCAQFDCKDDSAVTSPVRTWCVYGRVMPMSKCYGSKYEIASVLQECIINRASHGNALNGGDDSTCGDQLGTCTREDVENEVLLVFIIYHSRLH